jgi:hypothetical protein
VSRLAVKEQERLERQQEVLYINQKRQEGKQETLTVKKEAGQLSEEA